MKVPLAVPNLTGREAEYLQDCIESTFVSTAGPYIATFETGIAQISGTKRATVTCTGTSRPDGPRRSRHRFGRSGDDPLLTFIATANAVRHSQASLARRLLRRLDARHRSDASGARRGTEPHPDGRRHRQRNWS